MTNHLQQTVFAAAAQETDNHMAAQYYAGAGYAVLPLNPQTKTPAAGTHGWKSATTNENQIALWWETNPNYGIGIVPGTANVVAIDIDGQNGLKLWEQLGGTLNPNTHTNRTPGKHGGYHRLYTATDQQLTRLQGPKRIKGSEHLEAIAYGRYILAPPTIHPNGQPYQILHNVPMAPFPEKLLDLVPETPKTSWENYGVSQPNENCGYCPAVAQGCIDDVSSYTGSGRNDYLAKKLIRLLEVPCLQNSYRPWIDKMEEAYVNLDPNEPAHSRRKEFQSTLRSRYNKQMSKGGLGTGECKNALRKNSIVDIVSTGKPTGLVRLSDLEFREQKMLYKNLVLAEGLTMLAGAAGTGKSTWLRWLAAQVTNGTQAVNGEVGQVIWISSEEGYEGIVGPTLAAARARMDYVWGLDMGDPENGFTVDDNGARLKEMVEDVSSQGPPVRLVVLDSLDLFLNNTDANSSQQIKVALKGPAEQSMNLGFACIFVEHLNKREHGHVMDKVAGSRNKGAMVRGALGWGYYLDNPQWRRLSLIKSNFVDYLNEPSDLFSFVPGQVDITKADGTIVTEERAKLRYRKSTKLPFQTIWDEPELQEGQT